MSELVIRDRGPRGLAPLDVRFTPKADAIQPIGQSDVIALHRARARLGIQSGHPQFHLRAPEHLQGAGLVGHVFLRDLSLGEISVSLEPSTLRPPDCANNALFRSMWRHCDGRRYADRPLGAGGTQCELYVLWQS